MSGRGGYLPKVGWALVTIAVVITFNFLLFRVLPGDPAKSGMHDPRLNPAAVEALRERFGLDKPVFLNLEGGNPFDTQFTAYLGALTRGDLGTSYAFRDQEVSDMLGRRSSTRCGSSCPRRRSRSCSARRSASSPPGGEGRRRTSPPDVQPLHVVAADVLPRHHPARRGANWFGLPRRAGHDRRGLRLVLGPGVSTSAATCCCRP